MFCIIRGSIKMSWWHDVQLKSYLGQHFLWEGVTRHAVGCEDDVSMPFVIKEE